MSMSGSCCERLCSDDFPVIHRDGGARLCLWLHASMRQATPWSFGSRESRGVQRCGAYAAATRAGQAVIPSDVGRWESRGVVRSALEPRLD